MRAYPLTVGEYWLAASERGVVNTLYRDARADQLPARRALWPRRRLGAGARALRSRPSGTTRSRSSTPSSPTRRCARSGRRSAARTATCRSARSGTRSAAREMTLARRRRLRGVPRALPRWHLTGNDVYGRSPGMDALPDAKSLQRDAAPLRRDARQDGEPAHGGPPALRGEAASIDCRAPITYVADPTGAGVPARLPDQRRRWPSSSRRHRARQQAVRAAFYADLFLMATQLRGRALPPPRSPSAATRSW